MSTTAVTHLQTSTCGRHQHVLPRDRCPSAQTTAARCRHDCFASQREPAHHNSKPPTNSSISETTHHFAEQRPSAHGSMDPVITVSRRSASSSSNERSTRDCYPPNFHIAQVHALAASGSKIQAAERQRQGDIYGSLIANMAILSRWSSSSRAPYTSPIQATDQIAMSEIRHRESVPAKDHSALRHLRAPNIHRDTEHFDTMGSRV